MSKFRSIKWRTTSTYIFTILISVALLGFYLANWTENNYILNLESDLQSESRLLADLAKPLMSKPSDTLTDRTKRTSTALGRRVTIVRADGLVIADSEHDARTMENHSTRPEIKSALESGSGWSIRPSATLGKRMIYVASSASKNGQVLGVARLAEDLSQVDTVLSNIARVFFLTTILAIILAAFLGYRFSAGMVRRIVAMSSAAGRFAAGRFDRQLRVPERPSDEIDVLGGAFNSMASDIRKMMDELAEEKNMLETILSRSDDGLVVVDKEAHIGMVNPAAERFLGKTFEEIRDKTVIEGTFSHDLSELTSRVLRTGLPASLEIELTSPLHPNLAVYVASLERPSGSFGAVIVMHDVSEQRRIDSIRRDFVANVSHEFRTPLAAIKAMAETILIRGRKDPDAAARFAEKIMGEADRLTALSDDLLDLAKIEAGLSITRQEKFPLSEVADRIAAEYTPVGERRGIEIHSSISPDLTVNADKDAVYQILLNLVDNAVKYTPSGGKVELEAIPGAERVTVRVTDTGIGIPTDDLSRIFERFYRVDKARSRESGGTGLGLSIVKHLVEEHGGRVTAESTSNEGTTFTFTLPAGG